MSNKSSTALTKSTSKVVKKQVPQGATILSKEVSTNVEEINNGFLITKTTNIRYKAKGQEYSDYICDTQKFFSKDDPLEIKLDGESVADSFED